MLDSLATPILEKTFRVGEFSKITFAVFLEIACAGIVRMNFCFTRFLREDSKLLKKVGRRAVCCSFEQLFAIRFLITKKKKGGLEDAKSAVRRWLLIVIFVVFHAERE